MFRCQNELIFTVLHLLEGPGLTSLQSIIALKNILFFILETVWMGIEVKRFSFVEKYAKTKYVSRVMNGIFRQQNSLQLMTKQKNKLGISQGEHISHFITFDFV